MPAEDRSLRGNAINPAQLGKQGDPVEVFTVGSGSTVVQTTEPELKEGDAWLNPDTGIYYIAYNDDWHPVPPISETDEAATFTESGVTVSNSGTSVKNDSVALEDEEQFGHANFNTGSTISYDISCKTSNGWVGDIAFFCRDAATYTLTYYVNGSSAYSESFSADSEIVRIQTTHTDWSTLAQNGDTITVEITGGNVNESTSVSHTGELFDLSSQTINNQENGNFSFHFNSLPSDGSSTVSWGSPGDIHSWELVTYQETEDGGTVTFDVLDGSGNVLFEDVSKNFDISTVSNSTEVQIRANLSRTDVSQYPTADYVARRYTQ